MTAANSLNISEVGYCTFDGINLFKGRTFQAGAGINLTNANGISGNTIISTTSGVLFFTSPIIDFKTIALTTIFTTNPTLNFFVTSLTFICDSATAANSDSTISVGWTPANYQDLIPNSAFPISLATTWTSNAPISVYNFIPANTQIIVNVSSPDTGTSITGRICLQGFYT